MATGSLTTAPRQSLIGRDGGQLALRVRGTSHDGSLIKIRSPKCTIGSAAGCTLRLRARGVAPLHCWVLRGRCGAVIRRLHGPATLNGGSFEDAPLAVGDRLRVGSIELEVVECAKTALAAASTPFPAPAQPAPVDDELEGKLAASAEQVSRLQDEARQAWQSSIVAADRADQLSDALRDAHKQLEEACRELTAAQEVISKQSGELETFHHQLPGVRTGDSRTASELAESHQKCQSLTEERNRYKAEIGELRQKINQLQAECDAPRNTHKQLEKAFRELTDAQEVNNKQSSELEAFRRQLVELRTGDAHKARELLESLRKCQSLTEERNRHKAEAEELHQKIRRLQTELNAKASGPAPQAAAMTVAFPRGDSEVVQQWQSQCAELEKKIAALESQLATAQRQVVIPDVDENKLKAEQDRLVEEQRRIEEQEASLTRRASEIAKRESELVALQAEIKPVKESLDAEREALQTLRESLATERQTLETQQASLAAGTRQIDSAQAELAQQQTAIATQEKSISVERQAIEARESKLAEREAELGQRASDLEARWQELYQKVADWEAAQQARPTPAEPPADDPPSLPPAEEFEAPRNVTAPWRPLEELADGLPPLDPACEPGTPDYQRSEPADSPPVESANDSANVDSALRRLMGAGAWRQHEDRSDEYSSNAGAQPDSVPVEAPVVADLDQPGYDEQPPYAPQPSYEEQQSESQPLSYAPMDDSQEDEAAYRSPLVASSEPEAPRDAAPEEDSIEGYMERLLKRVRGDSTANPSAARKQNSSESANLPQSRSSDPIASGSQPEQAHAAAKDENEEFVPRSKAPEATVNLSAMRELANSAARSAINTHARRLTGKSAAARFGAGLLMSGFSAAVAYWAWTLHLMPAVIGAVAGLLLGTCWLLGALGRLIGMMRLRPPRPTALAKPPEPAKSEPEKAPPAA
jgi:uncharacterized coiled-coil DUF342 family protein